MDGFLSIPGELRNIIYKQLLVLEDPIDPLSGSKQLLLHTELLYTNKQIYHESVSVLYGHNSFDLAGYDFELLARFLNQIGRNNASYIQCIWLGFPCLRDIEDELTFEDDSSQILTKIQSDCTALKTLMFTPFNTHTMGLELDAIESPEIVTKALSMIDARFRGIASLKEVILEVYEDAPILDIRERIESQGWTINVVEREEEIVWDHDGFSGFGDDNYYNDSSEHEYGTDDNSDF
ncbi:uncharacterized protein TRUGW13939_08872 [Talaromyces rugulosus]|uniref:Uncharacterized protein n=1 Tax=Talaromyces rugulosus TaxID=121627 RepID=A0A7H8R677_TALRU|nr:uncharacterized protein TRUGW13939_08872 [Talaromyces rugulosus]QKX61717.1 hypothetical protein TRUGW13939_08872 [Talaromyces rugulosus]